MQQAHRGGDDGCYMRGDEERRMKTESSRVPQGDSRLGDIYVLPSPLLGLPRVESDPLVRHPVNPPGR
jgi:hypothetical protein